MRYKSFRIQNFKGIKDTTIDFGNSASVGVYTFVGLNESGKTTVLEAIHSFSPDKSTSQLVGGDDETGVPFNARVPRHMLSNFTGYVSVLANIICNEADVRKVAAAFSKETGKIIVEDDFPRQIALDRQQRFVKGDFEGNYFTLRTPFYVRDTPKSKKKRNSNSNEDIVLRNIIFEMAPDIAYFPSFVFDFPSKVFLSSGRPGVINRFYRQLFQDILTYDGKGHSIESDIIRRVRQEDLVLPWVQFFSLWNRGDGKDKIQHVIDRAAAVLTRVIFGRWNKIFRDNAQGKEVIVSWDVSEGEVKDAKGVTAKTNEHDIYVKFQIKDGTRRFDVNDRSLGFRWFFAFMLFTQFRVNRSSTRPIVFLFDEPASNLHAAAQQKLIESFPEVAKGDNILAYTTHSHYMIEPKWLEQTFIVTNRADAPPVSVLEDLSLDDESLDIKVTKYRSFVNTSPGNTSYFQPILDRLEVVPSRFDIQKRSIVVEGKSDYFVLRYAMSLHEKLEMPIIPGLGAGTVGALVALHLGWSLDLLFVLDGDAKGVEERERYVVEAGLSPANAVTLTELVPELKVIEDLLDLPAKEMIKERQGLTDLPTKNHIRRYFQERLAADAVESLGEYFDAASLKLLDKLRTRLQPSADDGAGNAAS